MVRFSPTNIYSARKEEECPFWEKFSGKVVVISSRQSQPEQGVGAFREKE
jgi:hypothetical protein